MSKYAAKKKNLASYSADFAWIRVNDQEIVKNKLMCNKCALEKCKHLLALIFSDERAHLQLRLCSMKKKYAALCLYSIEIRK